MPIEVFMADDHAVMRDGLRLLLEAHPDLRVVGEAATGREAVRQVSADCPDVLIMDIAMPDLNGIGATRQVRAAYAGRQYFSPKIAVALAGKRYLGVSPLDRLSEREHEILQLTVEGRSSAQIAHILMLSPKTVETYRSRIMRKLGLHDLPNLVKFAIQHGLTSLE